jgi:hypothetical protein
LDSEFSIDHVISETDAFLEQKVEGREAVRLRTAAEEAALVQRLSNLLKTKLMEVDVSEDEASSTSIEVEIRVGQVDQSFHPGMKDADYQSLFSLLKSPQFKSDFEVKYADTIDLFYTLSDTKFRLSCTPDETATPHPSAPAGCPPISECTSAISKAKVFKEDIKGIRARWTPLYDLRFSINTETVYGAPPVDENFPWTAIEEWRRKRRTSFIPIEKSQHWRIDMTEADPTVSAGNAPTNPALAAKILEVEFELKPESLASLRGEEDPSKLDELSLHVCRDFIRMANLIFDRGQAVHAYTPLIPGVRTTRISDSSLLLTLRSECLSAVSRNLDDIRDPLRFGFPGSMPCSLSRGHFEMIQRGDFLVSEKADGVRYFFFIFQSAAYLVDRKFDFFEVHGFEGLCEFFRRRTIVDGEIITDLTTQRPKFIVFDMIELDGDNCTADPTTKRLERIGVFIKHFRDLAQTNPTFPFEMIGKFFRPKEHILSLFEKIRGSVYHNDERRHYGCDGILLTPKNQPYRPKGANFDLLKWKFLEKQTVDFYVEYPPGRNYLQLCCEGDNESRATCRRITNLDGPNKPLVDAVQQRIREVGHGKIVAEFAYDIRDGSWKFHMIRKDKSRTKKKR